jgi:transketolase
MANAIRFLSMDAIKHAGEGHPGTPLGAADIATALFTLHLRFNPQDPRWFDRDRFVVSNGHGSMLLYALLHLSGYETITLEDIRRFRQLGSACEGHPEYHPDRGIEVTTGPLGQGIANAAGMALAEAFLNRWLGADLVDHYTYALVGDGCLQEGVGQEVISLAGHLRLGKLVFLWDDNRMTDDGPIDLALSDDMPARFRLSHWHVQEVDGHDADAVSAAILRAKQDPRPSMIACRTIIGRGLPLVEGTRAAHSAKLDKAQTDAARAYLEWPHPPFEIPPDVLGAWRAAGRRCLPDYEAWQARVARRCRRRSGANSTGCARDGYPRAGKTSCSASSGGPWRRVRPSPASNCRPTLSRLCAMPFRSCCRGRRIWRGPRSTSGGWRRSPRLIMAGAISTTGSASTRWGRCSTAWRRMVVWCRWASPTWRSRTICVRRCGWRR